MELGKNLPFIIYRVRTRLKSVKYRGILWMGGKGKCGVLSKIVFKNDIFNVGL